MSKLPEFIRIPSTQLVFSEQQTQEESFHQNDLIELFPYGITLAADNARPFLILKDATQQHNLPVLVSPIEAGVTLSQSTTTSIPTTPHRFTQELLESLQIKPLQCVFVQVLGSHQYVRIYLSGHPHTNSIRLRADECMSLCVQLGIPIFATKSFIEKSKTMVAEVEASAKGLQPLQSLLAKTHNYLM